MPEYCYPDGSSRWMQVDAVIVDPLAYGDDALVLETFIDITTAREANTRLAASEERLRQLATTDPLTGLANRRCLLEHLELAADRHRRQPERLAVLFVDLDGFKAVNDELGHEVGDVLLSQVAERLRSNTRSGDFVARYGGDEFVIVVEDLADPEQASVIAAHIEAVLSEPFDLGAERPVRIGGSVGFTHMSPGATQSSIMSGADAAMYRRKHERKRQRPHAFPR